jgi:predicted nucleic acid-binding protein
MNLVDSSAIIEYCMGTAAGMRFAPAIEDHARLIVPPVVIHEVSKRLRQLLGKDEADEIVAELMEDAEIIPYDGKLALSSARISEQHTLALADSIIYATAEARNATLWTQDEHFKGLPNVRYFPKTKT